MRLGLGKESARKLLRGGTGDEGGAGGHRPSLTMGSRLAKAWETLGRIKVPNNNEKEAKGNAILTQGKLQTTTLILFSQWGRNTA